MRKIEMANPDLLYGIFGDTQWSNKERLSDALLKDLVEHFSKLPMSNSAVEPDVLGQAYDTSSSASRICPTKRQVSFTHRAPWFA